MVYLWQLVIYTQVYFHTSNSGKLLTHSRIKNYFCASHIICLCNASFFYGRVLENCGHQHRNIGRKAIGIGYYMFYIFIYTTTQAMPGDMLCTNIGQLVDRKNLLVLLAEHQLKSTAQQRKKETSSKKECFPNFFVEEDTVIFYITMLYNGRNLNR